MTFRSCVWDKNLRVTWHYHCCRLWIYIVLFFYSTRVRNSNGAEHIPKESGSAARESTAAACLAQKLEPIWPYNRTNSAEQRLIQIIERDIRGWKSHQLVFIVLCVGEDSYSLTSIERNSICVFCSNHYELYLYTMAHNKDNVFPYPLVQCKWMWGSVVCC